MEAALRQGSAADTEARARDAFLTLWERIPAGTPHTLAVAQLSPEARRSGTTWLQSIVDSTAGVWTNV